MPRQVERHVGGATHTGGDLRNLSRHGFCRGTRLVDEIVKSPLDQERTGREQREGAGQQEEHAHQENRNQADENIRQDELSTDAPQEHSLKLNPEPDEKIPEGADDDE